MERATPNLLLIAAAGTVAVLGLLALIGQRHVPPVAQAAPAETSDRPLAGVTVVLDPGHGGADPGTTTGPLSEAALTYRVATELSADLRAEGADVVYTVHSRCLDPTLAIFEPPLERPADAVMAATGQPLRERHSARPLWQRAETGRTVWTKQSRRDPQASRDVFFLSLHFDQSSAAGARGGVVCVDRRSRQIPALAKALAAQMAQSDLGRSGDFRGVSGLSGRELGVLNPDYNPVPEKALLELATLSDPQNAREAEDVAWRVEVVRRITLAITQTHQR